MKKLFTMLMMTTLVLSLTAMAGKPTYSLKDGVYENAFSVLEPVQYDATSTLYKPSDMKLTYTVTGSINRTYMELKYNQDTKEYYTQLREKETDYDLGHVYFTANDDFRMALFMDIDNVPTSELRVDSKLTLNDYGIYLYENNDPTGQISQYISLKDGDYAITEGTNFGVYYTADTDYYVKNSRYDPRTYGLELDREDSQGVTYTTDANWVASFDGEKPGNHNVVVDSNLNWYSDVDLKSDAAIFCMFQGPYEDGQPVYLEWQHVEFGFVTTSTTGQPLPGTLATLLIGGLCASTLRKKNNKK